MITGKGKSGSTRTLAAKKHERVIFFLVGREKSSPGSDFSDKVINAAKLVAKGLEHASTVQIAEMVDAGTIEEICHD